MKKFVCTICGYVHEGDSAPARCPQCNAPDIKFNEQKEGMAWAAEHPEPVYPTWGEYLASIGVMKPVQHDKAYEVWFAQLYSTNIPADIAEKLGIAPKEPTP